MIKQGWEQSSKIPKRSNEPLTLTETPIILIRTYNYGNNLIYYLKCNWYNKNMLDKPKIESLTDSKVIFLTLTTLLTLQSQALYQPLQYIGP